MINSDQSAKKDSSAWLLSCSKQTPEPKLRLICFPFAGGNANTYRSWSKQLPDDIELLAIQLPGRGARFNEDCISDLPELIEQLIPVIKSLTQIPYVFFGHSMGAIIAYELCDALHKHNEKLPDLLMLSACSAPHCKQQTKALHSLPSLEFWEEVQTINGTPREILDNHELLALLEPSLRADFKIVYDWRQSHFQTQPSTLPVPMEILGGKEDGSVSLKQLEGWKSYSEHKAHVHLFDGDHFFINQATGTFFSTLSNLLASIG